MQLFYVKKNIDLCLPHKRLLLQAASSDALLREQVPFTHIYCGNIGWEVIHARKIEGDDCLAVMPFSPEIQAVLPPLLLPASGGLGLVEQIQSILHRRPAARRHAPIRLALINGVGTMLGDTLVGLSALEVVLNLLANAIAVKVEVHVILAWNARRGVESFWERSPVICHVQGHSTTLANLCSFDAYWDFSLLLRMDGYHHLALVDFYLNHFGINSLSINPAIKLPVLRLPGTLIAEAQAMLDRQRLGRKVVLLQGTASTPLRSMPDFFMRALINDLLSETDACVLLAQPLPAGLPVAVLERIVHLEDWCQTSTDHYLALVVAADAIVSIDSLAIHAAMAAGLFGVAIFTTLSPVLRVAYAPRLIGMLIPGAMKLNTWGKHKTDDNWGREQVEYEKAWAAMDREVIVAQVKGFINVQ